MNVRTFLIVFSFSSENLSSSERICYSCQKGKFYYLHSCNFLRRFLDIHYSPILREILICGIKIPWAFYIAISSFRFGTDYFFLSSTKILLQPTFIDSTYLVSYMISTREICYIMLIISLFDRTAVHGIFTGYIPKFLCITSEINPRIWIEINE